jgi:hypothetical protein
VHIVSHPVAASGLRIFVPSDGPAEIQRLLAKAKRRRANYSAKRIKRTDLKAVGRQP